MNLQKMRNFPSIVLLISTIASAISCGGPSKEVVTNADYAFNGVSVISMQSDDISSNQTVFVKGDKIVRIADTDEIQAGEAVELIDGSGKYLIPGLAEMHAHIPIPVDGDTDLLHETMMLFVAHGITTLRGMRGDEYHLKLRDQTKSGEVIGPRIFTCGARLNSGRVKTVDDAHRLVKEQVEAGFDFIKIHRGLSPELFHAIADAADEHNFRIAGHIPETVGLIEAMSRNYHTIDHFDGYMEALMPDSIEVVPFANGGLFAVPLSLQADLSRIDELVQLTKEKGAWMVPTHAWMERRVTPGDPAVLLAEPGMAYISPETREGYRRAKEKMNKEVSQEVAARYVKIHSMLLKKMHEAGVGTLFGCDAPQFCQHSRIFNAP